jgi:hypothetical protein
VCFLVCAHLHRIPLLHGSVHARMQVDLAVFSLSNTTSHLFSLQQHRSESFHMFRPQMTLRKRTRTPRPATVAPLGPGEAKRDNVFLLPAGRGVTTTYARCACCVTLNAVESSPNRMSFTLCMSAPTLQAHTGCLVLPSHVFALLQWWRVTFLLIGAFCDLSNT